MKKYYILTQLLNVVFLGEYKSDEDAIESEKKWIEKENAVSSVYLMDELGLKCLQDSVKNISEG
ncbi:MAG: hypothetical protein DRI86_00985 [Bacteroidetes bacterium]|nr:MAG: hypothetical protein DRI86_00985 [Bacteroidota bacterium]